MTMLIKGGTLHTMGERDPFVADILLEGDRIAAVGENLTLPVDVNPCTLSAKGLHVTPGLVDLYIREGPESDEQLRVMARRAGVTAGVIWPDLEGPCRVVSDDGISGSMFWKVSPVCYTDDGLYSRLLMIASEGKIPCMEITNAFECRRVLQILQAAGIRAVLARLSGCESCLDQIAESGCGAILGPFRGHGESPWRIASELMARGIMPALSCGYPEAQMKHLTMCAALCMREGMGHQDALSCITAVPADIARMNRMGRITPDNRADLVLFDGDPLLLSTAHVITIEQGKLCHE